MPDPEKSAGDKNIVDFVRVLTANKWNVKFWAHESEFEPKRAELLLDLQVEVPLAPARPSLSTWLKSVLAPDTIIMVCRPHVADVCLREVRLSGDNPIVFYGHDMHYLRERLHSEISRSCFKWFNSLVTQAMEEKIWREVDIAIYPTEDEADLVNRSAKFGRGMSIKIYSFDMPRKRDSAPTGKRMIFVGGFNHAPNVDAVKWFQSQILPLIKKQLPDAEFVVVGSNPTKEIGKLSAQGVVIYSDISSQELIKLYSESRIAVIPLRFGAGMKLKTIEALALGVPAITTSIGAQGVPPSRSAIAIADDEMVFANAAVNLLNESDEEWLERSRDGTVIVANEFSRSAMLESLKRAFERARSQRDDIGSRP